jgi:hypothetical protein
MAAPLTPLSPPVRHVDCNIILYCFDSPVMVPETGNFYPLGRETSRSLAVWFLESMVK